MNKAEIEAEIAAQAEDVLYTVQQDMQATDPNWPANYKQYRTAILDKARDGTVQDVNVIWYTVDEGTPQEVAKYRNRPKDKTVIGALEQWLQSLTEFDGYQILSTDRSQKIGTALVYRPDSVDPLVGTTETIFIQRTGGTFSYWTISNA